MSLIDNISLLDWVSQFVTIIENWEVIVLSNTSNEDNYITIWLNIHNRNDVDKDAELNKWVMLRPWQVISFSNLYWKISAIADWDVFLAINKF